MKDGRFSPVYDENDLTTVKADQVIVAIGQSVDQQSANTAGAEVHGAFQGRPGDLETVREGVFAGGDNRFRARRR